MRRHNPLTGSLMAVGGVAGLVVGLAAIDVRVREEVVGVLSGHRTGDVATAGARIERFASTLFEALKDQSLEHAPLTIFALGALVLVLFMLRVL
jgi:hypothetical protein